MKKNAIKLLSLVLAVIMVCAAFPVSAYAAAPGNTKITSAKVKNQTVTLKFKKVKKVTGYQVQYAENKKFKKAKKVNVKKNTATVKKLQPSKKYFFRVRAYVKKGKKTTYGKWSAAKAVKTKAYVVAVPAINKNVSTGIGSFNAKWAAAKGAAGYQLQYATDSAFKTAKTVKLNNKTLSKNVTGLAQNKVYYIRVRAYATYLKKTYYSKWSAVASAKTKMNLPEAPAAPTDLTVSDIEPDSFKLAWTGVSCAGYEITAKATDGTLTITYTVYGDVSSQLVDDLHAFTDYEISVRAFNENAAGKSFSDAVETTAKTPMGIDADYDYNDI